MWTAAAAVADVQAVLIAGVDPRRGQVSYSLQEAIDGSSNPGTFRFALGRAQKLALKANAL